MKLKFNGILVLLLVLVAQLTFAQERTVTGTVSDKTGMPLPGVSVLVKGTKSGTQTDLDGKFTIKAAPSQILMFSYIGMKGSQVAATSSTINVKLQDDSIELEGVIVGALGIKRTKNAVTAASQVVNKKELTQAANPNVVQSLVGKVSGLQINRTSGGVNGGTRIVLRGSRSITGNNEALIVIDNAISTAAALQQLPPELIESLNVVKGAQGAALYGEQGVNGVIIVTTVKGAQGGGKLTVSVNSVVDFETVAYVPTTQNKYGQGWFGAHDPYENGSWGELFDGVNRETGLPQADGNSFNLPYSYIKDNVKQFYQTGTTYQNGFSLNAGSEDGYVLLSANKLKTEFVVNGDVLERNSFLVKAGKTLGKFSIDANINYNYQRSSETSSGLLSDLIQTPGNIPISDFANSGNEGHWTVYYQSPYWTLANNRSDATRSFINAIAALKYEINKNINITYTGNVQFSARDSQSHINSYKENAFLSGSLGANRDQTSEYFASQSFTRNFYGDFLVNLNYDLTDDLNLKANIGTNMQDNSFRVTSQGGTNLDIPGFYNIKNVLSPSNPSALDNRYLKSNRVDALANVDLAFKDYLFLNLTGRQALSSVLPIVNNKFNYYSAGASFIPTIAFEGLKSETFSYAKLAASYTRVGNSSAVGTYAINEIGVSPTGFPYGNLGSYIANQNPTDKNIRPEFVATTELDLSLGFFNNRLTLDGSVYKAQTTDLITAATSSSASGLATAQTNIGDMTTTGYEIDLGVAPIKTKNFNWNLRASYSTNKSVINSLAEGASEINLLTDAATGTGIFAQVGQEFPLIKGTTFVRDANGSIIVNSQGLPSRTSANSILGKATPDYILGLTNSFEYKGIKLTVVMDYRAGHDIISATKYNLTWPGRLEESAAFDRDAGFILPNSVIETAPGSGVYAPNTTVASAKGYGTNGVIDYYDALSRTGEHNVIDASAFKVRELALSYSLPTTTISKLGLTALRIGVNARNPFVVLSKENKGYTDPEASINGSGGNGIGYSNTGQYPSTRTVGGSINLTF